MAKSTGVEGSAEQSRGFLDIYNSYISAIEYRFDRDSLHEGEFQAYVEVLAERLEQPGQISKSQLEKDLRIVNDILEAISSYSNQFSETPEYNEEEINFCVNVFGSVIGRGDVERQISLRRLKDLIEGVLKEHKVKQSDKFLKEKESEVKKMSLKEKGRLLKEVTLVNKIRATKGDNQDITSSKTLRELSNKLSIGDVELLKNSLIDSIKQQVQEEEKIKEDIRKRKKEKLAREEKIKEEKALLRKTFKEEKEDRESPVGLGYLIFFLVAVVATGALAGVGTTPVVILAGMSIIMSKIGYAKYNQLKDTNDFKNKLSLLDKELKAIENSSLEEFSKLFYQSQKRPLSALEGSDLKEKKTKDSKEFNQIQDDKIKPSSKTKDPKEFNQIQDNKAKPSSKTKDPKEFNQIQDNKAKPSSKTEDSKESNQIQDDKAKPSSTTRNSINSKKSSGNAYEQEVILRKENYCSLEAEMKATRILLEKIKIQKAFLDTKKQRIQEKGTEGSYDISYNLLDGVSEEYKKSKFLNFENLLGGFSENFVELKKDNQTLKEVIAENVGLRESVENRLKEFKEAVIDADLKVYNEKIDSIKRSFLEDKILGRSEVYKNLEYLENLKLFTGEYFNKKKEKDFLSIMAEVTTLSYVPDEDNKELITTKEQVDIDDNKLLWLIEDFRGLLTEEAIIGEENKITFKTLDEALLLEQMQKDHFEVLQGAITLQDISKKSFFQAGKNKINKQKLKFMSVLDDNIGVISLKYKIDSLVEEFTKAKKLKREFEKNKRKLQKSDNSNSLLSFMQKSRVELEDTLGKQALEYEKYKSKGFYDENFEKEVVNYNSKITKVIDDLKDLKRSIGSKIDEYSQKKYLSRYDAIKEATILVDQINRKLLAFDKKCFDFVQEINSQNAKILKKYERVFIEGEYVQEEQEENKYLAMGVGGALLSNLIKREVCLNSSFPLYLAYQTDELLSFSEEIERFFKRIEYTVELNAKHHYENVQSVFELITKVSATLDELSTCNEISTSIDIAKTCLEYSELIKEFNEYINHSIFKDSRNGIAAMTEEQLEEYNDLQSRILNVHWELRDEVIKGIEEYNKFTKEEDKIDDYKIKLLPYSDKEETPLLEEINYMVAASKKIDMFFHSSERKQQEFSVEANKGDGEPIEMQEVAESTIIAPPISGSEELQSLGISPENETGGGALIKNQMTFSRVSLPNESIPSGESYQHQVDRDISLEEIKQDIDKQLNQKNELCQQISILMLEANKRLEDKAKWKEPIASFEREGISEGYEADINKIFVTLTNSLKSKSEKEISRLVGTFGIYIENLKQVEMYEKELKTLMGKYNLLKLYAEEKLLKEDLISLEEGAQYITVILFSINRLIAREINSKVSGLESSNTLFLQSVVLAKEVKNYRDLCRENLEKADLSFDEVDTDLPTNPVDFLELKGFWEKLRETAGAGLEGREIVKEMAKVLTEEEIQELFLKIKFPGDEELVPEKEERGLDSLEKKKKIISEVLEVLSSYMGICKETSVSITEELLKVKGSEIALESKGVVPLDKNSYETVKQYTDTLKDTSEKLRANLEKLGKSQTEFLGALKEAQSRVLEAEEVEVVEVNQEKQLKILEDYIKASKVFLGLADQLIAERADNLIGLETLENIRHNLQMIQKEEQELQHKLSNGDAQSLNVAVNLASIYKRISKNARDLLTPIEDCFGIEMHSRTKFFEDKNEAIESLEKSTDSEENQLLLDRLSIENYETFSIENLKEVIFKKKQEKALEILKMLSESSEIELESLGDLGDLGDLEDAVKDLKLELQKLRKGENFLLNSDIDFSIFPKIMGQENENAYYFRKSYKTEDYIRDIVSVLKPKQQERKFSLNSENIGEANLGSLSPDVDSNGEKSFTTSIESSKNSGDLINNLESDNKDYKESLLKKKSNNSQSLTPSTGH